MIPNRRVHGSNTQDIKKATAARGLYTQLSVSTLISRIGVVVMIGNKVGCPNKWLGSTELGFHVFYCES